MPYNSTLFHFHFKCNSSAFQQRFILKPTLSHPIRLVYFICIKIPSYLMLMSSHSVSQRQKSSVKDKNYHGGDGHSFWDLAVNSTLAIIRAAKAQACVLLRFQSFTLCDIILLAYAPAPHLPKYCISCHKWKKHINNMQFQHLKSSRFPPSSVNSYFAFSFVGIGFFTNIVWVYYNVGVWFWNI